MGTAHHVLMPELTPDPKALGLVKSAWLRRRGHVFVCEVWVTKKVLQREVRVRAGLLPDRPEMGFDFVVSPSGSAVDGQSLLELRCGSMEDGEAYPAKVLTLPGFGGLYSRLWADLSGPCGWYVFYLLEHVVWLRLHMVKDD